MNSIDDKTKILTFKRSNNWKCWACRAKKPKLCQMLTLKSTKMLRKMTQLIQLCWIRYEDIGHAAAGYVTDAGQRPAALLLRLFHIRHRRRSTVVGYFTPTLLPQNPRHDQTAASFVSLPPNAPFWLAA